jgi:hypothetical protein
MSDEECSCFVWNFHGILMGLRHCERHFVSSVRSRKLEWIPKINKNKKTTKRERDKKRNEKRKTNREKPVTSLKWYKGMRATCLQQKFPRTWMGTHPHGEEKKMRTISIYFGMRPDKTCVACSITKVLASEVHDVDNECRLESWNCRPTPVGKMCGIMYDLDSYWSWKQK